MKGVFSGEREHFEGLSLEVRGMDDLIWGSLCWSFCVCACVCTHTCVHSL